MIIVIQVGRVRRLGETESGQRFPRYKIWRFAECTTPWPDIFREWSYMYQKIYDRIDIFFYFRQQFTNANWYSRWLPLLLTGWLGSRHARYSLVHHWSTGKERVDWELQFHVRVTVFPCLQTRRWQDMEALPQKRCIIDGKNRLGQLFDFILFFLSVSQFWKSGNTFG